MSNPVFLGNQGNLGRGAYVASSGHIFCAIGHVFWRMTIIFTYAALDYAKWWREAAG